MNRFSSKMSLTFIAALLLTFCGWSAAVANAGLRKEIATMPVIDNLTRAESPLYNEGNWVPFSWPTASKVSGKATVEGWSPKSTFPAADGAYWKLIQFSDMAGGGEGAAVTKENSSGSTGEMGAVWLDMSDPFTVKTGYRLSWVQDAGSTYTVKLDKFEAGTEKNLGEKKLISIPKGTKLAIVDLGDSVSAWIGTGEALDPLLSVKDSALSAGYAGVEGAGSSTRLANFQAGGFKPGPVLENLPVTAGLSGYDYPLSGGGKWSQLSWVANTGGILESYPFGWAAVNPTESPGGANSGAYWNSSTFSSSTTGNAVAAQVRWYPDADEHQAIWLNMPTPSGSKTGYQLRWTHSSKAGGIYAEFVLSRWDAGKQTLLAFRKDVVEALTNVYLVNKNGVLTVWVEKESLEDDLQLVARDSTYTSGYSGIEADGEGTYFLKSARLLNFRATTLPVAATAKTEPATKITDSEATLNAKINPKGSSATYQFEYGPTTGYGSDTVFPYPVGSGSSEVAVSEAVKGLKPETTYHFRVVARGGGGTTYGEDATFKTGAAPANKTLPVISPANPAQAVPEEATSGKWSGEPAPTLTFQWRRCNAAGAECVNISGATANSYTPGEADVSKTLVMAVTATNPFGSTTAYSAPTEKVRQLGQITEYALPAGSHPNSITRGPDGNFWYSGSASNQIGRITPTGTVTEVSTEGITPAGMASGGAKVWFAGTSKTAANMTTEGAITKFPTAQGSVVDVAWGADLRAWFTATEGSLIAIMKGGALTEYALPAGTSPGRIAKGPDGNLWFTDGASSNKIDKSTTSGVVTKYSLPSGDLPWDVAAGPDGNVWLTIPNGTTGKIGKMTTSGTLTEYSLPGTSPYPQGISPGPDGNVWFTMKNADTIGKITPSGKITTYSLPVGSAPQEIVEGGDGTLWFTEPGTGKIGVIVA